MDKMDVTGLLLRAPGCTWLHPAEEVCVESALEDGKE